MPQTAGPLILEIFRSDHHLKMSLFASGDMAQTLRRYSQCSVEFEEVRELSGQISAILSRTDKKTSCEPGLIEDLKKNGRILWDELFSRQVKERLKLSGVRGLVLFFDEELVGVPWELFYDGSDFLGLKFNLGRLIRTKYQEPPTNFRGHPAKRKMLILANPTADLDSAYLEGINIKNQFEHSRKDLNIDFKSTHIDTLYVKKTLREYDIVHFAGHCEYDRDDLQNTGWVLSDRRFTTRDILAMGDGQQMPGLVFSNGCHTARVLKDVNGRDYQEKNYSLASAFLFSGVRHYIGAVHKIEDPVSFSFAREFYSRLIKGDPVGECVRQARLRLVVDYGMNSGHWARYILYGDPDFVFFRGEKQRPAAESGAADAISRKRRRKYFQLIVSGLAAVMVFLFIYLWLPTLNPGTYFLFSESRRLFRRGDNPAVIRIMEKVVRQDPGFLAAYPLIADTYFRIGRRKEALKYYFDYMLVSQRRDPSRLPALAYIMAGWIYHQSGEYDKARDFYERGLEASRKNNDKLYEAVALRKKALWYMDKGDDNRALELLTKSSEINRQRQFAPEHRYNLACDYFDLGLLFVNKDDLTAAKEFYAKSLDIFKNLDRKDEISDYYFNLGEIYLFEKQYHKALDNYFKGLKIDQNLGATVNLSSDYNMIGEFYLEMNDPAKAEEFFKQAEDLSRQTDSRMELAAVSYNLGLLYKKKGRKNKAREYFRQAQEIYKDVDSPDEKLVKEELFSLDN